MLLYGSCHQLLLLVESCLQQIVSGPLGFLFLRFVVSVGIFAAVFVVKEGSVPLVVAGIGC